MFWKKLFKGLDNEYLIIAAILIILLNVITRNIVYNVEHTYNFTSDQTDTILYIQENIPNNYTILLPDLNEKNYLYNLLVGYKIKLYDNAKRGLYDATRGFLMTYNERYLVIDTTLINPLDYEQFLKDGEFLIIYSNNQNIIFWYDY